MSSISLLPLKLSALSVYRELLDKEPIKSLYELLGALNSSPAQFAACWGRFCAALVAGGNLHSLSTAVAEQMHFDNNAFTRMAAVKDDFPLDPTVMKAVEREATVLSELAHLTPDALLDAYSQRDAFGEAPFDLLPQWQCGEEIWDIPSLLDFHRQHGYGEYARYVAFVRRSGRSIPIVNPDPIALSTLKGYEHCRQPVIDNTIAFLEGLPANNCLLYGDRGTGKSSTVKALLNEYCGKGLRLIELPKAYLNEYPDIVQEIAGSPLKFLIFIDDLSFQAGDESYAALKGILEGGIASRPSNALIYATSNRRHLLNETVSARMGDELHASDTIQETLSLSDRFGVQVTFLAPDRANYYRIVHALAKDRGLKADEKELEAAAERWALVKGGRSPRTAVQFIDDAEARLARGIDL